MALQKPGEGDPMSDGQGRLGVEMKQPYRRF
jgi:hypothetical protein